MLKKLTKFYYKRQIDSNLIDIFTDYFQYEVGIELLLNFRMILYIIICVTMALFFYNTNIIWSYIILGVGIIFVLYNLRDIIKHTFIGTPSFIWRSRRMTEWIIRHWILKKHFLSKEEWDVIKKKDGRTYGALISGNSVHLCYIYALRLALQFEDACLVYAGIQAPADDEIYAHAFVIRNGEVLDTNYRRSYDVEDYYRLFNVKVYHEWNFSEYSEPDFKEKVSKDFKQWCRENHVTRYQYF